MSLSLNDRLNETIRGMAAHFDGQVTMKAGFLSPFPEMVFRHRGSPVFADIVHRPDPPFRSTVLAHLQPTPVSWPVLDLEIFPSPGLLVLLTRSLGFQVHRSYREVDAPPRLRTSSRKVLKERLAPDLLTALEPLLRMGRSASLALAATPGRFLLQKSFEELEGPQLIRYIGLALQVLDCLASPRETPLLNMGIEFFSSPEEEEEAARCRVCGEAMVERLVLCARCATPVHHECWSFNGRCPIYACGSVQCVK